MYIYMKLCVRTVLSFQCVHLYLSPLVTEEEDLTGGDSFEEQEMDTTFSGKQVYDCVICNQTTHSTAEKLMGLVVLVQVSITQCPYSHHAVKVVTLCPENSVLQVWLLRPEFSPRLVHVGFVVSQSGTGTDFSPSTLFFLVMLHKHSFMCHLRCVIRAGGSLRHTRMAYYKKSTE